MKQKLLVFTVVYPQTLHLFAALLDQVYTQSTSMFDFLVIQDEVDITEIIVSSSMQPKILNGRKNPQENREIAISYALTKGYDGFICLDSDDIHKPDKVAVLAQKLEKNDIVFHDLSIRGHTQKKISKSFIGNRLRDGQKISFSDILDKNFMGLGNSGFKTFLFKDFLPFPSNLIAVDWWMAMIALLQNAQVVYTNHSLTGYSQYEGNAAPILKSDKKTLERELNIKENIYENLLLLPTIMISPYKAEIKKRLQQVCFLKNHLSEAIEFNSFPENLFWWELSNYVKLGGK